MTASATIRLPALATPETDPKEGDAPAGSAAANSQVPDETLLGRIGDGNKDALALLFRRYAGLVRGVAFRVLRDSSEADDLLQDIFLQIYRKCRAFDSSKGPARFWIIQMTYHRAISRRRYLDSRHFYTRIDLEEVVSESTVLHANRQPYEDSIEAILGNGTLEKIFQTLSENQRETLRLFFQEGYTLDEIASELGQSRDNVKHHYFRGLEKLRKQIFGGNSRAK